MPNRSLLSFNAGELTPLLDARQDLSKYNSGCRTLQNMIPRLHGPAMRRPGFMYIADEKTESLATRLQEFEYSTSISYIIEFGNLYCRFYTSGAQLTSGGTPVELVTTYVTADLFQLQFKQINDTMWITHPDYPPRKLTRTSATAFAIADVAFVGGPFRKRNDILNADDITITPSATTGAGITLTASSATFTSDNVGSEIQLTQARATQSSSGAATGTGVVGTALTIKGNASFNTHGTWTGTIELQRNEDGTNWETYRTYVAVDDRNIQLTFNEEKRGVQFRMNCTAYTSGTINADLSIHDSTQVGYATITAYASTTSVTATVVDDFASTTATKRWAEGAWSPRRGYPKSVTFLEERAVYAGTATDPQTVWFSEVDDYEDFYADINDADSFALTINADKRNSIEWISALDVLIVGTTGGEWVIKSSGLDKPITPTDFQVRIQSTYGSAPIQATGVNEALLFVDRAARKIREFVYREDKQKYVAVDIMALAEHITEGGIVDVAYQKNPESIIWIVLGASPWLVSMSYDREQDVLAAATHPVGGSGEVESVAVIPGGEEDEVWISVKRTVNSATVRYVEQMQPWNWGSDDDDAFFVDSGLTYSGASATAISGLTHLEGESVQTLGNGVTIPNETVSSGAITLDSAITKGHIGLSYAYKVKPMKIDTDSNGSNTRGSTKKIGEIVINFIDTLNAKYGDGTDTFDINWPRTSIFEPIPLYTGDQRVVGDSGFSEDLVIEGSDPHPCTVVSLAVRIDKVGR